MAVLVHRANMHSEPQDWIARDGIHMIDETASVTWIKMRVRVWGGLYGFCIFFFIQLLYWVQLQVCIQIPTQCLKSQCNWWSLCMSMYTLGLKLGNISPPEIKHSWQQLSGSESAGKPNGVLCSIVYRPLCRHPQPPPVSLFLALVSKDLCGPRRQESLILRPGGPYTVLLHILHAYAAGHRERPLGRGDPTHSQQGIELLSIRGDINQHPIGANGKLRRLVARSVAWVRITEGSAAELGPIVEPN